MSLVITLETVLMISVTANVLSIAECILNGVFNIDPTLRRIFLMPDPLSGAFRNIKKPIEHPNFGRRMVYLFLTQALGWYTLFQVFNWNLLGSSYKLPSLDLLSVFEPLFIVHAGKHLHSCFLAFVQERNFASAAHRFVIFFCYLFLRYPGYNLILGTVGMICEIADFTCDLAKTLDPDSPNAIFIFTKVLAGITCSIMAVFRIILPVTLIGLSFKFGNIFSMPEREIILFFFTLTYFLLMNGWFITRTLMKIMKSAKSSTSDGKSTNSPSFCRDEEMAITNNSRIVPTKDTFYMSSVWEYLKKDTVVDPSGTNQHLVVDENKDKNIDNPSFESLVLKESVISQPLLKDKKQILQFDNLH